MTNQEAELIDRFVCFLIVENCEGCTECEPRLSPDWSPDLVCCEEGRAKWFMKMAARFKQIGGDTK